MPLGFLGESGLGLLDNIMLPADRGSMMSHRGHRGIDAIDVSRRRFDSNPSGSAHIPGGRTLAAVQCHCSTSRGLSYPTIK
jgi:hypothetical protein